MSVDDSDFWDQFYEKNLIDKPSPFAQFCQENYLQEPVRMIEFGSGSGRDLRFFHVIGHEITGYDTSFEAVSRVKAVCPDVDYQSGDFTQIEDHDPIDVVYSRWTIHSVDDESADRALRWVAKELKPGGLLLVEARTVNDHLFEQGTPAGRNAFVTDHYRRFLVVDEFRDQLIDLGFEILFEKESSGFSVYKDDDPILLRVVAKKI